MYRRGFSIIELVMVIGIIMILIGILLPTFRNIRTHTESTISMSNARQISTMLSLYVDDFDGVFPIAGDAFWFKTRISGSTSSDSSEFGRSWQWALIDAGILSVEQTNDPAGLHAINFDLSMALVYPSRLMRPASIEHPDKRRTSPVRVDQVSFPSLKGSLSEIQIGGDEAPMFWCCTPIDPPGAVAFVDGSVDFVAWHQLPRPDLAPVLGIGIPVRSTWLGSQGRDR